MGALVASQIDVAPRNPAYASQFIDGYHLSLYVAAAIAFAGALVATATVRKVRHVEPAEAAVAV
jgi:hypothetical protein